VPEVVNNAVHANSIKVGRALPDIIFTIVGQSPTYEKGELL
jgi:hypothetical protein